MNNIDEGRRWLTRRVRLQFRAGAREHAGRTPGGHARRRAGRRCARILATAVQHRIRGLAVRTRAGVASDRGQDPGRGRHRRCRRCNLEEHISGDSQPGVFRSGAFHFEPGKARGHIPRRGGSRGIARRSGVDHAGRQDWVRRTGARTDRLRTGSDHIRSAGRTRACTRGGKATARKPRR